MGLKIPITAFILKFHTRYSYKSQWLIHAALEASEFSWITVGAKPATTKKIAHDGGRSEQRKICQIPLPFQGDLSAPPPFQGGGRGWLDTEKNSNILRVRGRDERRLTQVALPLLRFRCHDMRLVRFFAFQKPAAGYFEALFRARFGLHLWHNSPEN